jgi:hypothetical protein
MTTKIMVTANALPASERLLLSMFILLMALESDTQFEFVNDPNAPIVFLDLQLAADQTWLANWQARGGFTNQVPICCGPVRQAALITLARPFQLAQLREALTAGRDQLPKARLIQASNQPRTVAPHRLLERTVQLIGESEKFLDWRQIVGFDDLPIVLFAREQKAYAMPSAKYLSPWSRLALALVADLRLERAEPPPGTVTDAVSYSFLKWQMAMSLSHGMLLSDIANCQIFSLSYWPDISALGGNPAHLRISALLMRRPCTLKQIVMATTLTPENVIAFINGCYLIGCLAAAKSAEKTPAEVILTTPKISSQRLSSSTNKGFLGMLGKLRAALNFGQRDISA